MISDIYPVMFLDGKNTYRLFMSMSENVILGKNTKLTCLRRMHIASDSSF